MRSSARWFLIPVAGLLTLAACKSKEAAAPTRRNVALTVAGVSTFDPNADVSLDAYWGNQRPDDYAVKLAFERSFDAMDVCVADHKQRERIPVERTLAGEMEFQVRLNPTGPVLGVNAKLPGKHDRESELKECLRDAVAKAPYPKYDGPPLVVEFRTELDAGTYWDEDA